MKKIHRHIPRSHRSEVVFVRVSYRFVYRRKARHILADVYFGASSVLPITGTG